MKRLILPLMLACTVAGCSFVSPEAKVRDRLIAAGVKPPMADCMAGKLVRKLDSGELKQLARVAKLPRQHPGGMKLRRSRRPPARAQRSAYRQRCHARGARLRHRGVIPRLRNAAGVGVYVPVNGR